MKTKEPIKLRSKKLADGSESLYLDTYVNGVRSYEYLRLYLKPERTKDDKTENADTLKLANAIKARRTVELNEGRFGMSLDKHKADIPLRDALMLWATSDAVRESSMMVITRNMLSSVFKFEKRKNLKLSQIDENWVRNYRTWLIKDESLKTNSKATKFDYLKISLAYLAKINIIQRSPAYRVENIKREEVERVFLTIEELRALAATKLKYKNVKGAFLFSCYTGLRLSDVEKLRWGDFKKAPNGMTRVVFRQTKTGGFEYMDLNKDAVKIVELCERKGDDDLVFHLPFRKTISTWLRKWAEDAGINKQITYHTSRHTFATLMLSQGVDIYTVSKLLGHKDVKTTQRYARVLDKKRQDAVNSLPSIFD